MSHVLYICDTCCSNNEQPQGAGFAQQLREAVAVDDALIDLEIRTVSCLNLCDEPLALALRAPDKTAYLFGGVAPATDLADTLALARLYVAAKDGEIVDARAAGRLRFCLKGRVPAL